jgi:flagellar hook-basal body complex protein FliE
MSISQIGMKAYSQALSNFTKAREAQSAGHMKSPEPQVSSFAQTLEDSMTKVQDLQTNKDKMIQSFASGETQNVHELMISLQKAGLAMNMTAAVRNKALEAFKELTRIQF